jgi:CO/xanthine dehydrogenase Mo-binding subunit
MMAPAAIASAIEDALTPFGVEVRELPITESKICRLRQSTSPPGEAQAAVL